MRSTTTAGGLAVLATTLLLGAGCTGDAGDPDATPSTATATTTAVEPPAPSVSPADTDDCAAALAVNGRATDAYLAQLRKWVAADDAAGRQAALTSVRRIFATWSKDLRTQAGRIDDPRLKTALTQYAGGVRAVADGMERPEDLERLENLDGSEIDVAANQLARVCP
jgi:hypothetical protein